MSRKLEEGISNPTPHYEIADEVRFRHNGAWLYGYISRVYNGHEMYHVTTPDGVYEVGPHDGLRHNR